METNLITENDDSLCYDDGRCRDKTPNIFLRWLVGSIKSPLEVMGHFIVTSKTLVCIERPLPQCKHGGGILDDICGANGS